MTPTLTIKHAKAKGTGAMVSFELHPAHDTEIGFVKITFAAQATARTYENGKRTDETFDTENGASVNLSINEVAKLLEVFRGYREKVDDGNGIFIRTDNANAVLTFEHRLEPVPGYLLAISQKTLDGELNRMGVLFSMTEAIVLSEALASSMVYLAFGVPAMAI